MSATSIIGNINSQINQNAPAVVLAIQAFGQNATGAEKQSIAVRVLTGLEVGSGALESNPNPLISGTALLVNMIVQIAKLFHHPAFVPAPVPPSAP